MNEQEIQDTLRTLKRPTVIERLRENIPFPKGSVPKNGLPFWERIPLASKLPIIEHPKGAFVLYRDRVGKKLWRQSPMNTFRLDDPYCLDVSYDYDPLHDANLAHIWKSRHRRKVLKRQGLISRRGEAVCTLYQFNNYRRYLQCIYRDTLTLEYDRMLEDQLDNIALNKAQECAEKAIQEAQIREQRDADSQKFRARLQEEEAQKVARIKERIRYFDELVEKHEKEKAEAHRRRVAQSRHYEDSVRYRNAVAVEIGRAKVAAVRQRWRLSEKERARRRKEQHEHLKKLKEKEVSDRWEEKREFQEQRLEREKKLLQKAEEERRLATELHRRKMEAEHLRMKVLFEKVKAAHNKEREEARKNNTYHYIYVNERTEDSTAGRGPSSTVISNRRNTGSSSTPHYRKPAAHCSDAINDDTADRQKAQLHFRRTLAMSIEAMHSAESNRKKPFDLWNLFRYGKANDNEKACDDEKEDCEQEDKPEDVESTEVQVATAMDALLTNVVQEYVHHRVMHTLKEVYHEALDQCHWLVEREERRQSLRYGTLCYHALQQDKTLTGSTKKMGYNPCCALCCGRYPKRKTKYNAETLKKKIETWKKRADRYRTILEEGVDIASETSEESKYFDDEEGTDGGRLDKNFEDLSINLRRRIIILASQSVDERFKKFTAHRWKILKEVELSVLMERLCNMMLLYDSKEFLPSAEFQWAADVLARDVMKEVRAQIRSERHDAAIQKREQHAKATRKIFRERPPKPTKNVVAAADEIPTCYCQPVDSQELDPVDVPLLRLHSRSPHQPSLPSVILDEI